LKPNKYFSVPYIGWMGIFVITPIIFVLIYSFTTADGDLTFQNFAEMGRFLNVFLRSFWLAFVATVICIVLGYPVAYILSREGLRMQRLMIMLIILPMWMNFLLRTYAWVSILERNGFVNSILESIGLNKLDLLYNNPAVLLGMVYNFLPFMILPIYSVLKKTDRSLTEAAQDLGASPRQVFLRLTLPLSIPGIISGITMVFMPATSTFIIADLLGGAQNMLIGNLIEQQFLKANDWHFGSAVSVILMALLLISFAIFSKVDKGSGEGALF